MKMHRTVGFVVFDRALALNLNGPAEVFSLANHLLDVDGKGGDVDGKGGDVDGKGGDVDGKGGGYELIFLSESGGLIRTTSGIAVETRALHSIDSSALDTLIVVGGIGADAFTPDSVLVDWIGRTSKTARRTCSVCNGAFLLAAAGLLDGRRAVTHECEVEALRAMYPKVHVELDPIYLEDGPIWTSAGMTAGIDLALALIEDDYGRRLALTVAKELVVFLHRSGGQAQFSSALAAQTRLSTEPSDSKLAELPAWIVSNLNADLSVESLARAVGMTPRTFARNFSRRHGGTPAKLVQDLRVEAARRHLESGDSEIKQIAHLCGFGDEERMRRAFVRRLGVPPAAYRDRFGHAARAREAGAER